jgi:acyl carrier protein
MSENIENKVKNIIKEQLDVTDSEITDDASFVDDLGADSLDQAELVMTLEEEFEMDIPDEDTENLRTVGSAIEYIKSKK